MSGLSVWIGPEAHLSVPMLFQLAEAKAVLSEVLDNRSGADSAPPRALRDAAAVRVDCRAEPGVAMFLVGESLRHDALLQPGRGPASDQLLARIAAGLGQRMPDACAGGNSTFVPLPKLLSGVASPDPSAAEGQPTLLAMAKAAGAHAAYVNNHEIWVVPEAGHDWQERLSTSYFSASDQHAIAAAEDFVLRTRVQGGAAATPRAVLVHLCGQHFPSEDR